MLFVFGSGHSTSTMTDPGSFVSSRVPICRSSQILICTALVMTRQVIYDMRLNNSVPDRITAQDFESLLKKVVTSDKRLVCEVL